MLAIMNLTFSSRSALLLLRPLHGPLPDGVSCVRNCFGNIYGPNFVKKYIYVQNIVIEEYKKPERKKYSNNKDTFGNRWTGSVSPPSHARRVKYTKSVPIAYTQSVPIK